MAEAHLESNVLGQCRLESRALEIGCVLETEVVDLVSVGPEESEADDRPDIDQNLRQPVGHLDSSVLHVEGIAWLDVVVIKSHVVPLKRNPAMPIELFLGIEDF
jgi:hypothetical protein